MMLQASVVFRDFGRVMVEADPCGRHDIGADVIEKILDSEVLHAEVQAILDLLSDQSHPWSGRAPASRV